MTDGKSKEETQSGPRGLQPEARGGGSEEVEVRKQIKKIREGHATGGYCDTEALKTEEAKLFKILNKQLFEVERSNDHTKQQIKRRVERELNGLAFKPRLVVAPDA